MPAARAGDREVVSGGDPQAEPVDDRRGVRLAVKHLAALGHRRIVHIAGSQETSTGWVRHREFVEACTRLGVTGEVCQAGGFTQQAGHAAAAATLAADRPTAIFAANDLMAVGCLLAAAEANLRVPQDLSVVGYDDMLMMDLLHPPLTTIRVPQYQMGVEAARLVIAIANPAASRPLQRRVQLAPTLIVRGSTGLARVRAGAECAGSEISDAAWERIGPLLETAGNRNGRWRSHRQVLAAIVWRTRTGQPWRALPECFGPWQTAWKRLDRWQRDGTWERVRAAVSADPGIAAELDWLPSSLPAE